MGTSINILMVEDRAEDAELLLHELRRAGYAPIWQRVETEASYLAALNPALDLILADYALPQFGALRALELLIIQGLDIPFIIVSGTIGEEVAVAAIRQGAADYLLKDRLARLGTAIRHAQEQRQMRLEALQAHAALQASAKLNRAVLRALTSAIAVLDANGTIIAINDTWQQFAQENGDPKLSATGIGVNYLDVCHRAAVDQHDIEAALTLSGLQALLDGRQPQFNLEYSCQTPHELRWYMMHATPLPDYGGIVVAHEDITKRKQAEQARYAAETNYRTLVEHIPGIIYQAAIDETSSTLYVNPQIEKMLGFSTEEWLADPQRWLRQLHPGDLPTVLDGVARARRSDESIHSEFRMLARDGREIWFHDEAIVVRDAEGQPRFLQGVMLDITDRKQIEQSLQESEARYRLITENTGDLISMTDQDGYFVYVSPSYHVVLGYEPSALIGQLAADLLYPAEQEVSHQNTNTGSNQVTQRWRHIDGSWRWIECQVTQVVQQGEAYAVGIGRDITERKRLEAQFLQAQKMESIGQLAGGIAHDFNNMLSVVIGFIGSAQEELPPDSPAQRALKIAEQSAWRGARLTRQLLTFARKQLVELRVLNLNTVILDLDKMLRRLIGEDVELVTLLTAELRNIRADIGQLEQVITNLVVNARDAMPNGGKLIIKTANVALNSDDTQQHIDLTPGNYILLAISDTGSGMDAEVQQHIFEPFFTTKEVGKGTGLGLATCYSIVKQHGGAIKVESIVGQGTTINIYLAQVDVDIDALPQNSERMSASRGTETVLLVEDEPLVRELERNILNEQGYLVLEAANGEEAWRIVQTLHGGSITLLVTDVVMPQLGGKALAKLVTSMYPATKVLFVSGYATDVMPHTGPIDPAVNFLAKPFTRTAFAHKVREVLDS